MRTLIYYPQDLDGICSANICRHFLTKEGAENINLIVYKPGADLEITPNDEDNVYVVGTVIESLIKHPNLTWIDSRPDNIARYNPEVGGYRVMNVGTPRLCWQWFNNTKLPRQNEFESVTEPTFVKLISGPRTDIVDYFRCGLESTPDFNWDDWCASFINGNENDPDAIITTGRVCLEYSDKIQGQLMKEQAFDKILDGYKFKAFNGPVSDRAFRVFRDQGDIDGFMSYYFDGEKAHFDLYYSNGAADLSYIAGKRGGKGNRYHAHFTLNSDQTLDGTSSGTPVEETIPTPTEAINEPVGTVLTPVETIPSPVTYATVSSTPIDMWGSLDATTYLRETGTR